MYFFSLTTTAMSRARQNMISNRHTHYLFVMRTLTRQFSNHTSPSVGISKLDVWYQSTSRCVIASFSSVRYILSLKTISKIRDYKEPFLRSTSHYLSLYQLLKSFIMRCFFIVTDESLISTQQVIHSESNPFLLYTIKLHFSTNTYLLILLEISSALNYC